MFNADQTIPCPVCESKITFDVKQLLMGAQFVCTKCQSSVGLSQESKPIVAETIQKLEQVKGKISNSR